MAIWKRVAFFLEYRESKNIAFLLISYLKSLTPNRLTQWGKVIRISLLGQDEYPEAM